MSQHDDNVKRLGDLVYDAGKRGIPWEKAFTDACIELGMPGFDIGSDIFRNPYFPDLSEIVKRHEQGLKEYRKR